VRTPYPPTNTREVRRGLCLGYLAAACLWLGCSSATTTAPDALEEVTRPAGLEQLDRAVREQFVALWNDLQRAPATSDELTGQAWGELGRWFDVYQYPQDAARCYRNASAWQPTEARWPYYLGRLAEDSGALEEAAERYTAASALGSEEIAPRVRLADLALLRQDLELAESLYQEVLRRVPGQPGALFGLGRLALLRDDAAAALPPLQRLAESQPDAVQVRYPLAMAWRRLGDDDKANEQLGRIPKDNLDQAPLELDFPWDAELRNVERGARNLTRRAVRAARHGEPELAAALFRSAVLADPEGPEKHVNYARALREIGSWAAAVEEIHAALRLAPAGTDHAAAAHLEMGRLLVARGRAAAAVPHLEAVLGTDPKRLAALLELGRAYHLSKRLEDAQAQYAAARDLDGSTAEVRFWNAALLSLINNHAAALAALDEDLSLIGEDPRLVLLAARLRSASPVDELRDVDRARRLLSAVSGPRGVLFAETAAMVAAAEGRFEAAVAWQRAVVDALDGVRPRTAAHTARRRLVLYQEARPCRTPWEIWERVVSHPVRQPSTVEVSG
jgi:tetratricopeptide (TPR) repeat protein